MQTNDQGQIINGQGQIALVYYQSAQVIPRDFQYVFVPQAGISMAWVEPKHVDQIRAMKGGCCSGKRQLFDYANEAQARIWTNKGGS